ncbi:hypothetical protein GRI97_14070 [Altererythrobacter xixiisoli]|uniref:DUF2059 domain-containing protein n=1 Tax=Croceibacterium xixiisoli TaxID=1476466 RepID=A0A6I4TVV1_9SPHN|nr:hypothetical protein [Croceibacterium xixiisoli]MXP00115.1 hypothetical protein [Croceibacterium xixiisoli]
MKYLLAGMASLAFAVPAMGQEPVTTTVTIPAAEAEDAPANASNEMAMAMAMMQTMFAAPELTAEQEARLPLATQLAEHMLPNGIYARAMTETFSSFIEPIMGMAPQNMPVYDMSERLGVEYALVDGLDQAQQEEVGHILDPVYEQRSRAAMDFVMGKTTELMTLIEPGMRRGVARSFATRLDEQQLGAVVAFFDTPAGAAFAQHSLMAFSDRQAISALMAEMPRLMESLPDFETAAKEATASLPAEREYADLSAADRQRLAKLLGISEGELQRNMAEAAENRAAIEAGEYDWEAEATATATAEVPAPPKLSGKGRGKGN